MRVTVFSFLFVLLAAFANAELLTPTTYSVTSLGMTDNLGLAISPDGAKVFRLAQNSTHVALVRFTRDGSSGALTVSATKISTLALGVSEPFHLGNCKDVKCDNDFVFVSCVRVTSPVAYTSRVYSASAVTLNHISTSTFIASDVNAGWSMLYTSTGKKALYINTLTSNIAIVDIANDGTLSPISKTNTGATPNSKWVGGSENCVTWTNDVSQTITNARMVNRSPEYGLLGDSKSIVIGPVGVYPTRITSSRTSPTQIYVSAGSMTLSNVYYFDTSSTPTYISNSSAVFSGSGGLTNTMHFPSDDLHLYLCNASSIVELKHSTNGHLNNMRRPSSSLSNAFGIVTSADGRHLYVNSGDGVVRFIRDAATTPAVISSPVSGTRYRIIPAGFSLPETIFTGDQPTVALIGGATYTVTATGASPYSINVDATNPTQVTPPISSIPDGTYTLRVTYRDQYDNLPVTTTSSSFIVDTVTQNPTLTSPASSARYKPSGISVHYILPEAGSAGVIVWTDQNGAQTNWTISATGLTAGTHAFTVNATSSSSIISSSGNKIAAGNKLTDGLYTVRLFYRDNIDGGNPASGSGSASNIDVDESTQLPTFIVPSNPPIPYSYNSTAGSITVVFILPETPKAGSVKLTLRGDADYQLVLAATTSGTHTKTFSIANPSASADVTSVGFGGAIPQGSYLTRIEYRDTLDNPAAVSVDVSIVIDTRTLPPQYIAPLTGTFTNPLRIAYNLPETPGAGTVKVTFADALGTPVMVLNMVDNQNVDFTWSTSVDPDSLTEVVSHVGTVPLPDATYYVSLSYRDIYPNHAFSTSSIFNVTLDTATAQPTLVSPTSKSYTTSVQVLYKLPDQFLSGSITLTFSSSLLTRVLTLVDPGNFQTNDEIGFGLDPNTPVLFVPGGSVYGSVLSISPSGSNIPDGTYTVTLSYRDSLNNAPNTASVNNVKIDRVTDAPTLSSPSSSTSYKNPIAIDYTVPETPLGGAVTLTIAGIRVFTFSVPSTISANAKSFNTKSPTANGFTLLSGSLEDGSVPDGAYAFSVSYRDNLTNPTATSNVASSVLIDTVTRDPTVTSPSNGQSVSSSLLLNFSLPESAAASSIKVIFTPSTGSAVTATLLNNRVTTGVFAALNLNVKNLLTSDGVASVSGGSALADGTYTVRVSYQDALGNAAASIDRTGVIIDTVTATPTLAASVLATRDTVTFTVTFPEAQKSGSVKLSLTSQSTSTNYLYTFTTTSGISFVFDFTQPTSGIPTRTGPAIPTGTYDVSLSYQDALGNSAATSNTISGLRYDTVTEQPTLSQPVTGVYRNPLSVSYILPEDPRAGSVKLKWVPNDMQKTTVTMTLGNMRENSFSMDIANLVDGVHVVSSTPVTSLEDLQLYAVTLSYQDALDNPVADSIVATNVQVRTTILGGQLISPTSNAIFSSVVTITYKLKEDSLDNSVKIKFTTGTEWCELVIVNSQTVPDTVYSFTWDTSTNPATSVSQYVQSFTCSSGNSLPNSGTYTVTLAHTTLDMIDGIDDTKTGVVIDREAAAASLLSPGDGATVSNPIRVQLTLPKAPKPGTVQLRFTGASSVVNVSLSIITAGEFNITINPLDAATRIVDGIYDVSLRYTDLANNVAPAVTKTSVVVDTMTLDAILSAPLTGGEYANKITFKLKELAKTDTIIISFTRFSSVDPNGVPAGSLTLKSGAISADQEYTLNYNPIDNVDPVNDGATSALVASFTSTLPNNDGYYSIQLSYQDVAGNAASKAVANGVHFRFATTEPILSSISSGGRYAPPLRIAYSLPDPVKAGTVKLTIGTEVLQLSDVASADFSLDITDVVDNVHVISSSATSIAAGTYTFILEYQTTGGAPVNQVTKNSVTIDTETQVPMLVSPSSAVVYSRSIPVQYTLPEAAMSESVQLIFVGFQDTITITLSATTAGAKSFTLLPFRVSSSNEVVRSTATVVPDGVYSVSIQYRDTAGNPTAYSETASVTIDSVTLAPTLSAPGSDAGVTNPINIEYNLPETPLSSSVRLFFIRAGAVPISALLSTSTSGSHSLSLDPSQILTSQSGVVESSPVATILPDGTYTVSVSYSDFNANADASASSFNVRVDTVTLRPTILTTTPSIPVRVFAINYNIPETPKVNSVKLTFTPTSGGAGVFVVTMRDSATGSYVFSWDPNTGATEQISKVLSTSGVIGDGVFSITVSYQDSVNNAVNTSLPLTGVILDRATLPPSLRSPVNTGAGSISQIRINYSLPEAPLPGSVILTFTTGASQIRLTMADLQEVDFTWVPSAHPNPTFYAPYVVFSTASSISDGTYTVSLSYQDRAGNNAKVVSNSGVVLDVVTRPVVLSGPLPKSRYTRYLLIQYLLLEAPAPGSFVFEFQNTVSSSSVYCNFTNPTVRSAAQGADVFLVDVSNPAASGRLQCGAIPNGIYNIKASYGDAIGNPPALTTVSDVLITTDTAPAKRVSVIISADYASTITPTNPVSNFFARFGSDLSGALGVSVDRFRFQSASSASISVSFDILPPFSSSEPSVTSVFNDFSEQFNNQNSPLRSANTHYTKDLVISAGILPFDLCVDITQTIISCGTSTGGDDGGDDNTAAQIGIGVSILLFVIIVLIVGWWIHYSLDKKKRQQKNVRRAQTVDFNDIDADGSGSIDRQEWEQYQKTHTVLSTAGSDNKPQGAVDVELVDTKPMPGLGVSAGHYADQGTPAHDRHDSASSSDNGAPRAAENIA